MVKGQKNKTHKILALDIGGTSIKAAVLDHKGKIVQKYQKVPTPRSGRPDEVVAAIKELVAPFQNYDKISVGFPGYVKKGIVHTAPNLGTDAWRGVNLNRRVSEALHKPVRIINDADMQGLGIASGKGLEMVITLGTGFGTTLLRNGNLLPHFELAHHAITKNKTYDDYIGNHALKSIGRKKWNKRVERVIRMLKTVFNYDRLYIGGGNSSELTFDLDDDVKVVSNRDGIKGGARVWQLDEDLFMKVKV